MKGNFGYFFREGSRNMFSHGFMSFAAIGITVACLLIMGTFSLVAYNADYNLKNLQKENAVLAFIDEALSDEDARALQSKVEAVPNVADAAFVSRQEARDSYVAQYDEDDLYQDLDPSISATGSSSICGMRGSCPKPWRPCARWTASPRSGRTRLSPPDSSPRAMWPALSA